MVRWGLEESEATTQNPQACGAKSTQSLYTQQSTVQCSAYYILLHSSTSPATSHSQWQNFLVLINSVIDLIITLKVPWLTRHDVDVHMGHCLACVLAVLQLQCVCVCVCVCEREMMMCMWDNV